LNVCTCWVSSLGMLGEGWKDRGVRDRGRERGKEKERDEGLRERKREREGMFWYAG
jgi:hypothetical protein